MYRRLLAPGLLLLLAACAQDPSVTAGTVRICDDTGCSDRPKDQVSYQKRDEAEDR
ncbi:sel1 repeat family protein, partial [Burkholderia cenocepacia]